MGRRFKKNSLRFPHFFVFAPPPKYRPILIPVQLIYGRLGRSNGDIFSFAFEVARQCAFAMGCRVQTLGSRVQKPNFCVSRVFIFIFSISISSKTIAPGAGLGSAERPEGASVQLRDLTSAQDGGGVSDFFSSQPGCHNLGWVPF